MLNTEFRAGKPWILKCSSKAVLILWFLVHFLWFPISHWIAACSKSHVHLWSGTRALSRESPRHGIYKRHNLTAPRLIPKCGQKVASSRSKSLFRYLFKAGEAFTVKSEQKAASSHSWSLFRFLYISLLKIKWR